MLAVYFAYGLAFFALGGAALLEARQSSKLSLGRQLPWLAAFGITHSLVEWSDMFLMTALAPEVESALVTARTILLLVSALLLIRFGAGLVSEVGPLPEWVPYVRIALLTPATLIVAYALVVVLTDDQAATGADVWARYLMYFPGGCWSPSGSSGTGGGSRTRTCRERTIRCWARAWRSPCTRSWPG